MTTPATLSVARALAFAKTSHAPIAVVDTGSAIAANADALAALGKQLVSAQFTGNTLYFPWVIDAAGVLSLAPKLTNILGIPVNAFYNVTDTAANIIAHAAQLLALGTQITLAHIQVADSAAHIVANAATLASLGINISLTINDSPYNVAANASQLLALAASIPVGGIHVTDTATNIAANALALAPLGSELSVTVADTATSINANLVKLLSLGNALHGIVLPDGTLFSNLNPDSNSVTLDAAHAIAFVKEGLAAPIHVVDSAGNLANNLDALAALGGQLLSVQDTSDYYSFSWHISVADVLLLATKMTDKSGNPGIFSNVNGSAAVVAAHASALLALDTQIGNGGIQITETAANVAANAVLLAGLGDKLWLTINDSTANVAAFAPQLLALGSQIDHCGIYIVDTAAHIAANVTAMSSLGTELSITIKDNATDVASHAAQLLTLSMQIPAGGIQANDTAANIAANLTALASLGAELSLMVTDTASNINANQAQLLMLGNALGSFALPDGTVFSNLYTDGKSVTLDASQAVAFAKEGLTVPIHVVDSVDNIVKNLDALAAMGSQLLSVHDTSNSGTFTGQINVADVLVLVPKLTAYYGVPDTFNMITDTAANVAAHASQLLMLAPQIATGGIHITDTVAHVYANATALAVLGTELSVTISDSAANVAANVTKLLALGKQIAIGTIQITDGAVNIAAHAAALALLGTAVSLTVNDTAANVAAHTTQLLALGAQFPAGSIHVSDTAAAIAANAKALATLGEALTVIVSDTAANINTNQIQLLSLGNGLTGFSLPDGTVFNNLNADGKSVTLDVTHAFAFIKAGLLVPFHIVDSGANMTNNLDALAALGDQLLSMQDNSGYAFFVWQISVADVLALAHKMTDYYGNADTFNHITDTAANVAAHAVQLLALGTQVATGGIRVTDSAAHITAYQTALVNLGTELSVTVVDSATNVAVNAAKLLALGSQIAPGGIHVTDNAANVAANASALVTLGAKLTLIVKDNAANINANQNRLLALGNALSGLVLPDGTSFSNLLSDGESVTLDTVHALAFVKAGLVAPIHVGDSSWNISNHLDALAAIGAQLLSVQDLSGYSPFFWQISVADVLALAAKMTDKSGKPEIFSDIIDSASNVAGNAAQLLTLGSQIATGGIHITDTAAHIAANTAALASLGNKLSITINDSSANVANHAAELLTLGALIAAGAIHITDTAANIAANAAALVTLGAAVSVAVTDTAAQINAHQAKLLSLGSALASFKLPDGASFSHLNADGKSVALNIADAITFIKEGLVAPIHVVDYGDVLSNNLDALAAIGDQLLSVQDISGYQPFQWQISAADVLALAPKLTDYWGHPDTFSNITDSTTNIAAHAAQLFALGLQIATGGIHITDTAAQVIANSAALAILGADLSVTINDTAANVATNAAQLLALGARISRGGVQVTDTAANIAANSAALVTLGTELSVTVNDTATQINANQAKLLSLGSTLAGFKLPDGILLTNLHTDGKSVTLDIAHAIAFIKEGLAAPIHVVDSNGNIANNLDALAAMGTQLLSLQDSSGQNPFYWQISVADLLALAPKMTDSASIPYTFNNVSDTAADVAAHIRELRALGTKIVAGGIHITDTAAHIAANAKALAKLGNELSVTISDSAANVATKATQLLALGPQIDNGNIQVTDTAANVASNITALATLGDKLLVTVADTAAHINANQAKLLSLGYALGAFTLPNGISFGQFGNLHSDGKSVTLGIFDATVFVQEGLTIPIRIVDSGWSMSSSLDTMAAMGKQLLSVQDSSGNNLFTWQINIADVLALAPKMTDSKGNPETFATVGDSAANLEAKIDGLEGIAGQIANIKLTNAGTPTVTVTAAQASSDVGVLNIIQSPYLLSVQDTAANLNGLALGAIQTSLIEIMPTSLLATLTENRQITDLNLSHISLAGDSITEKAYGSTGTEIAIVASNGAVVHQLFFANNTESQLHLLGIGNTMVQVL